MTSQTPKNVHLVVLVHGLWGKRARTSGLRNADRSFPPGNPRHLAVAHEELQQAYERACDKARQEGDIDALPELQALVAQGNEGTHTYDGIDVCAGRVAKEIDREVRRIEKDGSRVVRDFSIMGYSVGGCKSSLSVIGRDTILIHTLFFSDRSLRDRCPTHPRSFVLCQASTNQFYYARCSSRRDHEVSGPFLAMDSRKMGIQPLGSDGGSAVHLG